MKINLSLFKIKSSLISFLILFDIFTFTLVSHGVEENKVTADCRTIADVADNSTVKISRLDDESSSGVIIAKKGNIYTVLTVAHGVKSQEILDYETLRIQSQYGEYNVIDGQLLDDGIKSLDLAIIRFKSSRNYLPITFGSSQQSEEGKNIYLLGYPLPNIRTSQPEIKPIKGILTGVINNRGKGYNMRYVADVSEGMSGGSIVDVCGRLLGIHGRSDSRGNVERRTNLNQSTGETIPLNGDFASGIPVDYFIKLLPLTNLSKFDIILDKRPLPKRLFYKDRDTSEIITGFSKLDSRNYKLAIEYFTKSIEKDPQSYQAIAHFYRGFSYSSLGDKQEAINDYSKALELNSNLSNARYNRGLILLRDFGYYNEALKDFEELIKRNPRDADALLQRGHIYFEISDRKTRIRNMRTKIRIKFSFFISKHNTLISNVSVFSS